MPETVTFDIVPIQTFELRRKVQDGDRVLIRRVGIFDKVEQAELFRDQLIEMDVHE